MKNTADALRGKKIGFFGLGKSNLALLRSLPLDESEVILRSDKKIGDLTLPKGIRIFKIYEGDKALSNIREEILFLSPSVRRDRAELREAAAHGVKLSSDAELFFEINEKPIYAVSGSDGKSTTATLTSLLLSKNKDIPLIGNIGKPMFPALSEDADGFVCELSSFMLSYAAPKSKRACITNITPNHLDYHGSFEEYAKVKLSLLDSAEDRVICFDDAILQKYSSGKDLFAVISANFAFNDLRTRVRAKILLTFENNGVFVNGKKLLERAQICKNEVHNLKNLMCAIAMSYGDVTDDRIRQVAKSFSGLPHRCEYSGQILGVDFYDSSIDSTPARTAKTLYALGRKAVVILGGKGKGVSYDSLCEPLSRFCHKAVLYGEDAENIYSAIRGSCPTVTLDGFDEAVDFAIELGRECGAVILSPAATSYDQFKSYEERGERFKELIKKH